MHVYRIYFDAFLFLFNRILFFIFKKRSYYVALAVLELCVDQDGFKHTEIYLTLSPSAGIKGVYHHSWPKQSLFNIYFV